MSNDKYFDIFKTTTDHEKWNKQIEYASAMDGIDETIREEFVSALIFMGEELGKGFLKTSSFNHPVKQMISNKADWQTNELIQFAATLKTLQSYNSNYPKLKSKLLALEKSKIEGIPFTEIAEFYLKENFIVFYPDETNIGKSPDIEITNPSNNDKFFIEVSLVNDSDETKRLSNNYNFLFHQFHFVQPYYFVTGKQKTEIATEDYSAIANLIADKKKQVEETLEIVSYSDNRFEFWLAPASKLDELDKIAEQNGTQRNNVTGMPLNFDETDRLIKNGKIKHEAAQIPKDSNGIIYFPMNPMYFIATDKREAILRLQEYVLQFQNLIGVVFYSSILNQQKEEFIEVANHIFSRKMLGSILCRELLFVYNHNCDLKLADETIQKIYSTFKK
ncbi:MAG: hypothetical protein RL708_2728 [Bacteroidota bacterium]|jgi:hypothetical protein